MVDTEPQNNYFNYKETLDNIHNLEIKLKDIVKHKEQDQATDIDAGIVSLLHQMSYFWRVVYYFYPLSKTCQKIRENKLDYTKEQAIVNEIETIDLASKKAFLVLTAFSFEEILNIIVKKYNILINKNEQIIKKFMIIIDYFEIEREEYIDLVKIFYYTRNTLHSGTFVTKDSGPLKYKGKRFDMKKGQKHMEHTSWNHFTYFTSQIIDIFAKIYKSKKFKYA